ncbi:MAG: hypothetical protein K2X86_00290 [Cytophagaceae bacterium]|nr:hypothetical protein [Cytophagaceae bacterium]
MISLFLTILLSVFLFIIFRYFKKLKINSFHAVVVNYFICITIGVIILHDTRPFKTIRLSHTWVQLALLTGSFFLPCFYLMALTVQKVNVSVATVANKMSLAIPILFSFMYLKKGPDSFSILNFAGIVFALLAVFMTYYRKEKINPADDSSTSIIFLPLMLFILGGFLDTMINYINYIYLEEENRKIFPIIMFSIAAFTGGIIITARFIIKREFISIRDVAGGIILGVPNFFSMYFLLRTLTEFDHNASIVFTLTNIGVIITSALASVILFKEKLSMINLLGIMIAIISIVLLFS